MNVSVASRSLSWRRDSQKQDVDRFASSIAAENALAHRLTQRARRPASYETPPAQETAETFAARKQSFDGASARRCADAKTSCASSAAPSAILQSPLPNTLGQAPSAPHRLHSATPACSSSKTDCSTSNAAFAACSVGTKSAISHHLTDGNQQLVFQQRCLLTVIGQYMYTVIRRLLILLQRQQRLHGR